MAGYVGLLPPGGIHPCQSMGGERFDGEYAGRGKAPPDTGAGKAVAQAAALMFPFRHALYMK